MRKTIILLTGILLMLATGVSIANKPNHGEGINITISPSTLLLARDTACVTVHSNIPLGAVDRDSLLLEGIPPLLTKADACGELVAKFDTAAVKAILSPGTATLTLEGMLADGEPFAASDTITVK